MLKEMVVFFKSQFFFQALGRPIVFGCAGGVRPLPGWACWVSVSTALLGLNRAGLIEIENESQYRRPSGSQYQGPCWVSIRTDLLRLEKGKMGAEKWESVFFQPGRDWSERGRFNRASSGSIGAVYKGRENNRIILAKWRWHYASLVRKYWQGGN